MENNLTKAHAIVASNSQGLDVMLEEGFFDALTEQQLAVIEQMNNDLYDAHRLLDQAENLYTDKELCEDACTNGLYLSEVANIHQKVYFDYLMETGREDLIDTHGK